MSVIRARAGIRRLPSSTFTSGSCGDDDRQRVREEDQPDLPLGHASLVLGEDREHLELARNPAAT